MLSRASVCYFFVRKPDETRTLIWHEYDSLRNQNKKIKKLWIKKNLTNNSGSFYQLAREKYRVAEPFLTF
jgi:hypothetical protein